MELDRQTLLTPDTIIKNSASVRFGRVSRSRVENCHQDFVNKDRENRETNLLAFIT